MIAPKSLENLKPFAPGHKVYPRKKTGTYLTPLLRKCLEKKIDYIDPETNLKINGRVKDAIIWRLILNAAQGDNDAIKEVLNRVDGKTIQKLIGEGFGGEAKIIVVRSNVGAENKPETVSRQIPV